VHPGVLLACHVPFFFPPTLGPSAVPRLLFLFDEPIGCGPPPLLAVTSLDFLSFPAQQPKALYRSLLFYLCRWALRSCPTPDLRPRTCWTPTPNLPLCRREGLNGRARNEPRSFLAAGFSTCCFSVIFPRDSRLTHELSSLATVATVALNLFFICPFAPRAWEISAGLLHNLTLSHPRHNLFCPLGLFPFSSNLGSLNGSV